MKEHESCRDCVKLEDVRLPMTIRQQLTLFCWSLLPFAIAIVTWLLYPLFKNTKTGEAFALTCCFAGFAFLLLIEIGIAKILMFNVFGTKLFVSLDCEGNLHMHKKEDLFIEIGGGPCLIYDTKHPNRPTCGRCIQRPDDGVILKLWIGSKLFRSRIFGMRYTHTWRKIRVEHDRWSKKLLHVALEDTRGGVIRFCFVAADQEGKPILYDAGIRQLLQVVKNSYPVNHYVENSLAAQLAETIPIRQTA